MHRQRPPSGRQARVHHALPTKRAGTPAGLRHAAAAAVLLHLRRVLVLPGGREGLAEDGPQDSCDGSETWGGQGIRVQRHPHEGGCQDGVQVVDCAGGEAE